MGEVFLALGVEMMKIVEESLGRVVGVCEMEMTGISEMAVMQGGRDIARPLRIIVADASCQSSVLFRKTDRRIGSFKEAQALQG
jgi:hypothetical protein